MLVKQIANLFELMNLFASQKQPLSVKEIVTATGWPRSSAFNIVTTLVELGFLYQVRARGGYYPTGKWMDLAKQVTESQPLPECLHQLLLELKHQTGETVFLTVQEGGSVVCLDVVESSADIRFIANIGQRLPIHVTASGKALLSQLGTAERNSLLSRLDYQSYEGVSPDTVASDIERSLTRGWFCNMGVYAAGVGGVAVPFEYRGRRGAIALGGPLSRIEPRAEEFGVALLQSVTRFINNLG